tara:strand:- start:222 stop:515 length:294 start_codon:yes stop_codon:yes gene_type:complete
MDKKEEIIKILKKFEQRDYKLGGVSLAPEMYNAVAEHIVKLFAIPVVMASDFDDKGWTGDYVKCDLCGLEWVAMYHENCDKLECKKCGNMVRFHHLP